MCGICGFVSKQEITLDQLNIMNNLMANRGPDGFGAEIIPLKSTYCLGLANRRLKFDNTDDLGHQPMYSIDRSISLVFNGEIFNYRELKKELNDYPFKSGIDTEVIIAAYMKWGIEFVKHLKGSFAIALFDKKEDAFYLVRDHIGIKPLYYQWEDNNLYFASVLKPLMARPGFKKEIRKDILSHYLFQQYINHPDSIFESVYKLSPGEYLYMDLRGKAPFSYEVCKYFDVAKSYHEMIKNPVKDYTQARHELKDILKKATADRLNPGIPVGAFLSGGIDSSLTTALAMDVSSEQINTFSVGFHIEEFNEAKYAKAVADYLGTNHTEIYISENDMLKLIDSIPEYYDEPFADSSQIPSMLAAELASRDVKVVLSGDGGDEFFCGYNIYKKVKQAQMLDIPGACLNGLLNLPGIRRFNPEQFLPFAIRTISANRNPEMKVQFGIGNYVPVAEKMVESDEISDIKYPFESRYQVKNWQIRRMLLDIETYLPAVISKVDRATMKYSLETRSPILDIDVIEYSFRLAHDIKYKKSNGKRILKDIAYEYVPRELLDRPKVGFGVPLDKWLRGPLREQLTDMVNEKRIKEQGLFDYQNTADLVRMYITTGDKGFSSGANYSVLVWSFFIFQKWYDCYF